MESLVNGLVSCQDWVDEKLMATVSKTYKYNIIGIAGPESTEPYIELRYCKDDGHGNNMIVKEMLSRLFSSEVTW